MSINRLSIKINVTTATHGLIVQKVRASNRIQWKWVQMPLGPSFYCYFKESFSGEYIMYQVIPLHSCDYLNRLSIKINLLTDEGKSRNEIRH